ncbi:unnamed protein product [Mesocestoides corti]|uniref:TRPM-like domain-containing protein n=2 Tax=Mesocestoides corti TaxID=53468 RepID=A0A158QTF1_MESCO|nr:unnamed protein product [Mesocestoides corti]
MSEDEINYKIASILKETDEQDFGAFYLRERPAESPAPPPAPARARRVSSSSGTPRTSRRSSRVSFKLPSPQLHHPSAKVETLNLADYMEEVLILRQITEEYNHLVSVFDSDDTDMDGYVISALLSSAGLETPLSVLNTEQLEVTIRLNRADIAKEKIFTEGRHWKRHDLDSFMFDAILNDQEAFVSLFVENGFDLEAFLTVHTLEKLYTASIQKKDSKLETIRRIWETCRIYKMDWVMLRDVGRMVKHLLGEFYRPYYLSKHFRKMIKRAVVRHEAEEKEVPIAVNPWISKKSSYFAPLSPEHGTQHEQTSETHLSYVAIPHGAEASFSEANSAIEVPERKPSGIVTQGPRCYRKIGVVVPLENGQETCVPPPRRKHYHEDDDGKGSRLFVPVSDNKINSNGASFWSKAPVVHEEDFDVTSRSKSKQVKPKRTGGHVNIAFKESQFEIKNLCEQPMAEHTEQMEKRQSINADPPSSTSMDDTLSALRKSSFAGRHRGHHRMTVSKLSAAERSRLRSAEARRREAVKAEESERRRRHRLAQDKRSLYERLRGININQRFAAMQKVRLERPARELMLLCILLGKLKLAVLFWGYEKEPIGGAMFCTLLLSKLAAVCTDISQKLEFERYARIFEGKAEEVLEACYAEDNERAKMLLFRKLQEYGHSAVIRLAARGGCIHFMSHPCCQDFLSEVWMGKLSSKTTTFQLLCGAVFGLLFPFILPQVMPYARNDSQKSLLHVEDSSSSDMEASDHTEDEVTFSSELDYKGNRKRRKPPPSLFKTPRRWFNRQIKDITQYYHAPVTRFLYNTIFYVAFLVSFSNMILQNLSISYTIQEGLIFIMVLALLLEELKQAFGPGASLKEYLGDGWNKLDCIAIIFYLGGFVLRSLAYVQVRDVDIVDARRLLNATWDNTTCASKNSTPMSPFSEEPEVHLGSLPKWAALPGLRTPSSVLVDYTNLCAHDLTVDHPYFLLMEERFTLARVMFALSLFAFFVRLMYIFSFSIVLGPKLIMINRMVVNDLLPFLLLLVVIQAGYGVSSFVISYPNGYYTHYSEKTLSRNMTMKSMTAGKIVYEFFMTAYFQMLGNFGLDILEGEDSGCRDGDLCPQFSSRKLSIVSLSFFILLTQLLMINLLVATFTSTYFEIEGSSTYFWSYQRYEMIQECVDRPSVAPPFTLLWYIGELLYAAIQRLLVFFPGLDDFEPEIADDPFCRNFSGNYSLESKLMKWEFMKAQNVLRSQMDSDLPGSRRSESSRSTIITRGLKSAAGMAGGGGGGTTGAGNKRGSSIAGLGLGDRLLEDLSTIFGPDTDFIEGRFYALSSQVEKMSNFEDRLERIVMKSLSGPGERRLVGARRNHSPEKKQITSQSIDNVIRKAIEGLSEHCQDIEGKIEEKLRIEGLCVKAVLANSYPSEIPPDHVAVPTMTQTGPPSRRPEAMPPSGGLYERVIFSHRLWRLVPFNFERRPGMRVNIPDDLSSWKVPYPEYRPFISKSERIAFPYPEAEDGPQIDPTKLQYNTYDAVQGVSRCGLHERVHVSRGLQCARGLPLNPRGRSGLGGKGLLPHWGPNHVIVLALTREGTSPNDFEVIMLERGQCSCLPWISDDFLDDQLNADHAWIEAVCINFHGRGDAAFDTASTKLFLETSSSESARWFDFKGPVRLRPSHESLLIGLLQKHHKI